MAKKQRAAKALAPEFEALVRACFANPDDDTPRLVFADYLDENGQSDRAALIRYQCEQARLKTQMARHKELAKLISPLVAKFREQIEPLPDEMSLVGFRRGFVRLEGGRQSDPGTLPGEFIELLRGGWVESIGTNAYFDTVTTTSRWLVAQIGELDVSQFSMNEKGLMELVADTGEARATGRLARVKVHKRDQKTFDLLVKAQRGETVALAGDLHAERHHHGLTPRLFTLLLRTGRLSGAHGLYFLFSDELGDAELTALLTADLSELRTLQLLDWPFTRTGFQALANSPKLASLTTLELAGRMFADVLARATGLRGLAHLQLSRCELTDANILTLAASKSFPDLTVLALNLNAGITARGAAALLVAKHLTKLARLDLDFTGVVSKQLLPLLFDAPERPFLTLLSAEVEVSRWIRDGEVQVEVAGRNNNYDGLFWGVVACPGAKRVTQFAAPGLHIGAAEVAALAVAFDEGPLWRLDLTDNPLHNDGAVAIAHSFAKFKLRELILRECKIQSAGVGTLLNSSLWANMHALDLSGNVIGKAGVAALLKAPVPSALRELVLTECGLNAADKKQLKAKFGTKVKV